MLEVSRKGRERGKQRIRKIATGEGFELGKKLILSSRAEGDEDLRSHKKRKR